MHLFSLFLAKSSAQKFAMPELQHISRIEIQKEGIPRTPYQKRAPPMVKLGHVREKGKSAPPEGQCKDAKKEFAHGKIINYSGSCIKC